MSAEIGLTALTLAFALAVYAILASLIGARRGSVRLALSGRNAALLTFPAALLATSALVFALITEQYQLTYVYSVTDPQTPALYRFTALWGSQKGSLLLWSLLMSGFTFAAIGLNWRSERRLMPYAIAYMMATLAFFLGLSLFVENPFERWWILPSAPVAEQVISTALIPPGAIAPAEANLRAGAEGLNPLLRHFGMVIHPPMLYLGFVGFTIPFAFAMAALASGDLSTGWIKATRRWSLIAWICLSIGLILGGRWAYDVLGWGGYWGWDPVENAAFLPWLVGTAFIHSVMIQEKRGMLKRWNMVLVIASFSAVMFGTFATRSGVIESVHSFARSEVGFPMLAFWAAMTMVALWTLLWRWRRGELGDERHFANLSQPRVAVCAEQRRLHRAFSGDILGQFRAADHIRAAAGERSDDRRRYLRILCRAVVHRHVRLDGGGAAFGMGRDLGAEVGRRFEAAARPDRAEHRRGGFERDRPRNCAVRIRSRALRRLCRVIRDYSRRAGEAAVAARELAAGFDGAFPAQSAALWRLYRAPGRDRDRHWRDREHRLSDRGAAFRCARRDDNRSRLYAAL